MLRQFLFTLLFLFGITVIITCTSAYYSNRSSNISEAILKDNYNSVVYTKDMLKAISMTNDSKGIDFNSFEKSLKLQQNNITEKGEKELTDALTREYFLLKKDSHPGDRKISVDKLLFGIMELNMKALEDRSHEANISAQILFTYFIVAFILFVIIAVILIAKSRPLEKNDIKTYHSNIEV